MPPRGLPVGNLFGNFSKTLYTTQFTFNPFFVC